MNVCSTMKRGSLREAPRKRQKWESAYDIQASDEEVECVESSDEEAAQTVELRASLSEMLMPVLPINPFQWRRINRWWQRGAPKPLLCILTMYMMIFPLEPDSYDMIEYFAGCATLSRGFEFRSFKAWAYELKLDHILNDFLGLEGYLLAICLAFRLNTISLASFAPVCSSWVWISRSKTGRTVAYPLGFQDRYLVNAANIQVARCVMLIELLMVRAIHWVLEQPMSSWLFRHPLFQRMLRRHEGKVFQFSFNMGILGAPTGKPTTLFTNFKFVEKVLEYAYARKAPDAMQATFVRLWDEDRAKYAVTGNPQALKRTQAYPCGYGRAMVS